MQKRLHVDRDCGGLKVNIGTFIGWRKSYKASGDVKTKVRRPAKKKIIHKKQPCSRTPL